MTPPSIEWGDQVAQHQLPAQYPSERRSRETGARQPGWPGPARPASARPPARPVRRKRNLLAAGAIAAAALMVAPLAGAGADDVAQRNSSTPVPGVSVPFESDQLTIAPGMELATFSSLEADGWSSGSVLTVDLDADVTFDYQYSGTVTEAETVRAGAERSGATAAVNADFFDINNSYAPLGPGVSQDQGLISSPVPGRNQSVAVTADGAVRLAEIFLESQVAVDDGPVLDLSGVNSHQIPPDGIGLFTPLWGEYTRAQSVGSATERAEVTITDGVVADVGTDIGAGPIPEGTVVLVGRDTAAKALLDLEPGDAAEISYAPRSDIGEVVAAVGGDPVLVRDGVLPRVDALTLDAPDQLAMGETGAVSATVRQDDTRTVPVAWPASATWSGRGVYVGDPEDAPGRSVVALDPEAGTITALRAGLARLTVTVNGESVTHTILAGR